MNYNYDIFEDELLDIQKDILKYARSLTNNDDEANELLKEVNIKLLDITNRDKYRINLKSWALALMRKLFINDYMCKIHTSTYIQTETLYKLYNEEYLEIQSNINELRQIANSIKEKHRVPFSMFVSGYSYEEIANQLGIPEATVKRRIYEFRKISREKIADNKNKF